MDDVHKWLWTRIHKLHTIFFLCEHFFWLFFSSNGRISINDYGHESIDYTHFRAWTRTVRVSGRCHICTYICWNKMWHIADTRLIRVHTRKYTKIHQNTRTMCVINGFVSAIIRVSAMYTNPLITRKSLNDCGHESINYTKFFVYAHELFVCPQCTRNFSLITRNFSCMDTNCKKIRAIGVHTRKISCN